MKRQLTKEYEPLVVYVNGRKCAEFLSDILNDCINQKVGRIVDFKEDVMGKPFPNAVNDEFLSTVVDIYNDNYELV